jgi:hypothetical protein
MLDGFLTNPDGTESAMATQAEVDLAYRFIGHRCKLGPTLVVPAMVLWQEFRQWSPKRATAHGLRAALDLAPWVTVQERPHARGRLKAVVLGVGFKATAPS